MTLDQTIKSPPMSDYLTHPWKSGAQLAIERENVERQFGVSVSTSLSYVNYVTAQESKFGRVAPFDEWHDQYKLAMAREVRTMCRGREQ